MKSMSLDRRAFIGTSGLLVVAVAFPDGAGAAAGAASGPAAAVTVRPQIVISPSGDVKLWSPTSEMGQGTHTAHAAIIADELGLDIARVTIETAEPADAFRRAGPGGAPGSMASGGSMGVRFWAAPNML